MIAVENTVLVLLAAGRSDRFGTGESKLAQPFLSRPLGLHVAVALEDMPFKERLAVVSDDCTIDYTQHGFTVLRNDAPDRDMASSFRIGVECAKAHDAQAVLVALADMPRVTATHIYHILEAADSPSAVVASSNGVSPLPPALFGRERFDELLAITGDQGARDMIKAGRHVVANAAELIDVDTPEDLERLRQTVHAPEALNRPQANLLRQEDAI